MITFAYQAREASGKVVSGVQEAINEENALNTLMARGLMVLSIRQKSVSGRSLGMARTVNETDLVLFTRQLATMVDAGLPLISALTTLFEQSDPRKQRSLRAVVGELTARVQQGDSFAEALARQPKVFNRLYVSMVKAGETGGLLAEILDRLASFLEASSRLKKKVKSAMTYPVVVILIAIGITAFLIIRVVPVFGEIFAEFGAELPAPTKMLMNVSDFARAYWWIILLAGIGAFFGIKAFVGTTQGALLWDRWKLKLPVFGTLVHKICMTRFARTFAQLIRSGVPILEVMEIVGETSGNLIVAQAIKKVSSDVERGDPLAASLARQTIFPPMMVRMVAAGETTGKIDTMLDKMAAFWDEEIEATLNALTSLIEPFLIVFLGVVIGGIVIAMFLPIFKLNDIVSATK
jgi:type IV pilus assembly protein PilC